jgi:hypothetical protein
MTTIFGPWVSHIDPIERGKQFRSLTALAAVFLGSQHQLVAALRAAETDDGEAAERALELLNRVPALTRRRMLSVFGSATWPRPDRRRG